MIFARHKFSPYLRPLTFVAAASAIAAASPALAQSESSKGPYAVARAGVQVDSDLKTEKAPARTAPVLHNRNIDGQSGFVGEIGAGYDFGGFRLEGTVGYNTSAVNAKRLSDKANIGSGRLKSLDFGVSAYADLIQDGPFKPFIGGGIAASRVSDSVSLLERSKTKPKPGVVVPGARINDSDWGFKWHLDAGVGYEVAPGTTFEVAGRYARTTSLNLTGNKIDAARVKTNQTYNARASSASLLLGIRQRF